MIKIGLTGNIASGKSEAEKIIESFGYKTLDLDIISHELLNNECKDAVFEEFGTTDRKKLAEVVFRDKNKLKKLENIIHPKLKKYVLNYFKKNKNEKLVIISGALIFEAEFNNLFDKVIFVDADADLRIERLMKRNSFDKETALRRINAQNDKYKSSSDYVILNNSSMEALKNKICKILQEIIE